MYNIIVISFFLFIPSIIYLSLIQEYIKIVSYYKRGSQATCLLAPFNQHLTIRENDVSHSFFPPRHRCSSRPLPPPLTALSIGSNIPTVTSFCSCRWMPPPRWFKLNFNGSVYNYDTGRASIGGAICDSASRLVLSFTEKTKHSTLAPHPNAWVNVVLASFIYLFYHTY